MASERGYDRLVLPPNRNARLIQRLPPRTIHSNEKDPQRVLAIAPRYSDIEAVNRSLRFNIGAAFLGMLWLCVPIGAPLPLLMQVVEASSTQLGLLSASWQAAMLVQIPAALFSESLRRR